MTALQVVIVVVIAALSMLGALSLGAGIRWWWAGRQMRRRGR